MMRLTIAGLLVVFGYVIFSIVASFLIARMMGKSSNEAPADYLDLDAISREYAQLVKDGMPCR